VSLRYIAMSCNSLVLFLWKCLSLNSFGDPNSPTLVTPAGLAKLSEENIKMHSKWCLGGNIASPKLVTPAFARVTRVGIRCSLCNKLLCASFSLKTLAHQCFQQFSYHFPRTAACRFKKEVAGINSAFLPQKRPQKTSVHGPKWRELHFCCDLP